MGFYHGPASTLHTCTTNIAHELRQPRTWRLFRGVTFAGLFLYAVGSPKWRKDADDAEEREKLRQLTLSEERKLEVELAFEARLSKELQMTSGKLLELAETRED
mmetsp:Transcript_17725/g.44307  ORF Transcript_17725/g.44307 Transcript_17725/m.44307 type:complete len:104 (-) Transcript_17725:177-488(-)